MKVTQRSRQRGISFFGLLIVGVVLALLAIVVARVVPTVTEYRAIQKTARKVAADNGHATSVPEIQRAFDLAASADYITSIRGTDLKIVKNGEKVVISYAYDKEIPLFGPAFLLIKYTGSTDTGYR